MRFETRRRRRRREAIDQGFPDEWRELLRRRWPVWPRLSDDERHRMEGLIKAFVFDIRWEPANNFDLTDSMKVLIAAQACLLVLELDGDPYRGVGTIIVHPTAVVLTGPRSTGTSGLETSDPFRIDGQAHYGGPIIVAWDAVLTDSRHPARGHNVVYHEFAHKLDMLDGTIDGTPPLITGDARSRWIEVCTREFDEIRAGTGGLLRDYGGTDPGEFFAVATEMFFSRPVELLADKPDLYGVLSAFYRQNPAARFPAPVVIAEQPG